MVIAGRHEEAARQSEEKAAQLKHKLMQLRNLRTEIENKAEAQILALEQTGRDRVRSLDERIRRLPKSREAEAAFAEAEKARVELNIRQKVAEITSSKVNAVKNIESQIAQVERTIDTLE